MVKNIHSLKSEVMLENRTFSQHPLRYKTVGKQ